MSENIQSISQGTFTIGQTSATNFVAGPGIKIDEPSAGTVRIGNDETVLYSGSSTITTGALSEPATNFNYLRVSFAEKANDTVYQCGQLVADLDINECLNGNNCKSACMGLTWHNIAQSTNAGARIGIFYLTSPTAFSSYHVEKDLPTTVAANNIGNMWVSKVIGFNRKENV